MQAVLGRCSTGCAQFSVLSIHVRRPTCKLGPERLKGHGPAHLASALCIYFICCPTKRGMVTSPTMKDKDKRIPTDSLRMIQSLTAQHGH
eukprot:1137364-Pelagomonas_calceolata.AAC.4